MSLTPAQSATSGWAVTAAVVGGVVVGLLASLAVSVAQPAALYHPVAQPRLAGPGLGARPSAGVAPRVRASQPRQTIMRATAREEPAAPAVAEGVGAAGAAAAAGAAVGAAAAALVGRRRAAATLVGLTAAAPLLAAPPARALLPKDDDNELPPELKQAYREKSLAKERELIRQRTEVVVVQNAIIGLSVVGNRLAAGVIDGDGRKAAAGLPVEGLKEAVGTFSATPAVQQL
eukprot:EG_transcript_27332